MKHHLILRVVTKMLIPSILLFALYVQFHGDFGPGGGFQAGVIFAAAFILYAIVFGLETARRVMPTWLLQSLIATGLILYAGVGFVGMFLGGNYLNYTVLTGHAHSGQHIGLLLIELGVGITVSTVMIAIYFSFASRTPRMGDEDW